MTFTPEPVNSAQRQPFEHDTNATVGNSSDQWKDTHVIMTSRAGTIKLTMVVIAAVVLFNLIAIAGKPAAASAQTQDNVVLEWNLNASTAFTNPPTAPTPGAGMPPQVGILHMAMVQGAVYDAVNSIEGGYSPYLSGIPSADKGASKAAAVATAAHHVIVGVQIDPALAPEVVSRVDAQLADALAKATATDGQGAVAAGVAAGEAAAAAMLAERQNDGRYVATQVVPGTRPGEWQPTPPSNASDPFAWVGNVEPFMLESASQFRSKGPNDVRSVRYARDYKEVKQLGGPTAGSSRSAKQEAVAQFFTVNPTELYNRAFRTFAEQRGLSVAEQARLFAMMNLSAADAIINCFNDKLHYNAWRPITAIHNGDNDGNPWTKGDPGWTSLGNSPAYSEHASGYNCLTAGFMHAAADFFGNGRVNFQLVKIVPDAANVTRTYKHFVDVIDETIDARVYQGIHFRTSDEQGAKIGKDVAKWMKRNYFKKDYGMLPGQEWPFAMALTGDPT